MQSGAGNKLDNRMYNKSNKFDENKFNKFI